MKLFLQQEPLPQDGADAPDTADAVAGQLAEDRTRNEMPTTHLSHRRMKWRRCRAKWPSCRAVRTGPQYAGGRGRVVDGS